MDSSKLNLGSFAGLKVFVRPTEQESVEVKRKWKERLFSLPWKPLQRTKIVELEEAKKRNREMQILGKNMYVTQEIYNSLLWKQPK